MIWLARELSVSGRSRTGLGLFATAPIKKGAFIVEYKGRKLTTEQADKLEARGNRYLYEINSRWTIDGAAIISPMSSRGVAANATSVGRNEPIRARRHASKADEVVPPPHLAVLDGRLDANAAAATRFAWDANF